MRSTTAADVRPQSTAGSRRQTESFLQELYDVSNPTPESAAALACTRLSETVAIRDHMVERYNEVEAEIETAIEAIKETVDRGEDRADAYDRLDAQISNLVTAKEALQSQSVALGELIESLLEGEGSPSAEAIDNAETQEAIDNAREVFGTVFDLVDSIHGGPGIGTVVEVVKIGSRILTESATLLREGAQFNAFATTIHEFVGSEPPEVSENDGAFRELLQQGCPEPSGAPARESRSGGRGDLRSDRRTAAATAEAYPPIGRRQCEMFAAQRPARMTSQ